MLNVLSVSALGNVITVTYAASRVNQGKYIQIMLFSYLFSKTYRSNHRARERGHPAALRKQVLGVELAHREVATARAHRASHTVCRRHHCTAAGRRVPVHPGCRGIPAQIINLFIVVVRCPSFVRSFDKEVTFNCAGPVLATVQETGSC